VEGNSLLITQEHVLMIRDTMIECKQCLLRNLFKN